MTLRTMALGLVWILCPPAFAQETPEDPAPEGEVDSTDDDEAKRLFTSGAELYEEGRYEQAILAFQQAYELSNRHALLKNIANAQERLGDLQGAVDSLNQFRIYADDATKASLETRVRVLEDRIAKEREARMAAEVAALQAAQAEEAARAAAAENATPAEPQRAANPVKWVVLGSGAALTAGFGAATVVTYGNGQNAADSGDRTAYDNARTLNTVSGALAMVGGGILAVGIALPATRNVSVAPGANGIHLFGRF